MGGSVSRTLLKLSLCAVSGPTLHWLWGSCINVQSLKCELKQCNLWSHVYRLNTHTHKLQNSQKITQGDLSCSVELYWVYWVQLFYFSLSVSYWSFVQIRRPCALQISLEMITMVAMALQSLIPLCDFRKTHVLWSPHRKQSWRAT